MKGINGRLANLGSLYFERKDNGEVVRKYCAGYFNGQKIGLTHEEVDEFLENSCHSIPNLVKRILHAKILIP